MTQVISGLTVGMLAARIEGYVEAVFIIAEETLNQNDDMAVVATALDALDCWRWPDVDDIIVL